MYKMVKDQVVISMSSICYIWSLPLSIRCSSELVIKFKLGASTHTQKQEKNEKRDGSTRLYTTLIKMQKMRWNRWWQLEPKNNNSKAMPFNSISHSLHTIFYITSEICLSRSRCGRSFCWERKTKSKTVCSRSHIFSS